MLRGRAKFLSKSFLPLQVSTRLGVCCLFFVLYVLFVFCFVFFVFVVVFFWFVVTLCFFVHRWRVLQEWRVRVLECWCRAEPPVLWAAECWHGTLGKQNHLSLLFVHFLKSKTLFCFVFLRLPFGTALMRRAQAVIDEEMRHVGFEESVLPQLQPRALWDASARWDALVRRKHTKTKKGREKFSHSFVLGRRDVSCSRSEGSRTRAVSHCRRSVCGCYRGSWSQTASKIVSGLYNLFLFLPVVLIVFVFFFFFSRSAPSGEMRLVRGRWRFVRESL